MDREGRDLRQLLCFAVFSIGLSVDADNGHIGAQRSKLSSGGGAYSGAEIPFHACPQPFNKPASPSSSSVVPNAMSPKTRRQHAVMALDLWAYNIHYGIIVPFTRFVVT
jgi:hypothetical protein